MSEFPVFKAEIREIAKKLSVVPPGDCFLSFIVRLVNVFLSTFVWSNCEMKDIIPL